MSSSDAGRTRSVERESDPAGRTLGVAVIVIVLVVVRAVLLTSMPRRPQRGHRGGPFRFTAKRLWANITADSASAYYELEELPWHAPAPI